MIESASTEAGTGAGTGTGTTKPGSAGALLRAAREKQGLHIAALAAAIKVSPRKLDALENDRWAELPDATFTRALAQTVCRTLKLDARPVLELLPAVSTAGFDATGASLNMPFREHAGRDDTGIASAAIRPMVWAGLLFMCAAVLVYVLPEHLFSRSTEPGAAGTAAPAAVATSALPASAASASAVAGGGPAPSGTAQSEAAPMAGAQPSSAGPVETAMPPTAGETVFSAPAPGAAGAGDGAAPAGLVQLRANEASWIEARDARGQVLLSRTVLPGESVGLDGSLPIRLTIGNAAATQLGFRGQPVDLASRTRDNVARLDLQ